MKEVDWRIKSILDRRNMRMELEASLHGKTIKSKRLTEVVPMKIDKDKDNMIKKAHEAAIARKKNG